MTFRTIELRDANGDLVCEEPIHQPKTDPLFRYATFNGRLFVTQDVFTPRGDGSLAKYDELDCLRCGRAVIHDGQIEGVEVSDIVEAVGGSNAT